MMNRAAEVYSSPCHLSPVVAPCLLLQVDGTMPLAHVARFAVVRVVRGGGMVTGPVFASWTQPRKINGHARYFFEQLPCSLQMT